MDKLDLRSTFFSYDTVGFSDVLCRYSLGANPRGVTDSVVAFSCQNIGATG